MRKILALLFLISFSMLTACGGSSSSSSSDDTSSGDNTSGDNTGGNNSGGTNVDFTPGSESVAGIAAPDTVSIVDAEK